MSGPSIWTIEYKVTPLLLLLLIRVRTSPSSPRRLGCVSVGLCLLSSHPPTCIFHIHTTHAQVPLEYVSSLPQRRLFIRRWGTQVTFHSLDVGQIGDPSQSPWKNDKRVPPQAHPPLHGSHSTPVEMTTGTTHELQR